MAFLRIKNVKGLQYFYLVENKRDIDGKTRQEIIEYLGAPAAALVKAQALGLPQGMIEKIKKSIPPSQKYMLFRLSEDNNLDGNWFLRLSEEEFDSLWERYIKNS